MFSSRPSPRWKSVRTCSCRRCAVISRRWAVNWRWSRVFRTAPSGSAISRTSISMLRHESRRSRRREGQRATRRSTGFEALVVPISGAPILAAPFSSKWAKSGAVRRRNYIAEDNLDAADRWVDRLALCSKFLVRAEPGPNPFSHPASPFRSNCTSASHTRSWACAVSCPATERTRLAFAVNNLAGRA